MDLADLIRELEREHGHIEGMPPVLAAMSQVDRKDYLPDRDIPLYIISRRGIGLVEQALAMMSIEEARLPLKLLCGEFSFLTAPVRALAYNDAPLPIGFGQTCSAPSVVAVMSCYLGLELGMRVLEIGSGCGYHAAVTKELIGPTGKLFTVERIPDLADLAAANLERQFGCPTYVRILGDHLLLEGVNVYGGDGSQGIAEQGPFDRIYMTCAANSAFDSSGLVSQLAAGGFMLYPRDGYLCRETTRGIERLDPVAFVPLVVDS